VKPDGNASANLWNFDTCHEGIDLTDKTFNADKRFLANIIRTSKYSCLSFCPLNLFEQFKKKANLYFTLICIL